MTNLPVTKLVCQSPSNSTNSANEYYGNRGIKLIRDNVFTSYANMAAATPSFATTFTTGEINRKKKQAQVSNFKARDLFSHLVTTAEVRE